MRINKLLGTAFTILTLAAPMAANATTIYSNDFSVDANGFTGANALSPANGGQQFLGQLAGGTSATLTLNTTGYSQVTLNFDLYTLNSLDGDADVGDSTGYGPDYFDLTTNSGSLLHASFANYPSWLQSFGGPNSPSGTGSDPTLTGSLGYGYYGPDHTYHLSFVTAVSGPSTQFTFIGNSDQGAYDEGFGIDNVFVAADVTAVPEPATWAMFLIGFGAIGFVLRGAKQRTAATA